MKYPHLLWPKAVAGFVAGSRIAALPFLIGWAFRWSWATSPTWPWLSSLYIVVGTIHLITDDFKRAERGLSFWDFR